MEEFRKIEIRENYNRVLENIENAKAKRNAGFGDVKLLAATKTVPAEEVLFAVEELGLNLVGENKVQEFLSKYDDYKGRVSAHIIGHLQTNKVKSVIGKADMIQSVDSVRLAQEISKRSLEQNIVTPVLLEINIGEERDKSGIMPGEFEEIFDSVRNFSGINICGIMTMAPVCANNDEYRKYFAGTYEIYIDILQKKLHNVRESILSMGMSDSYEAAIAEGATMVRVGSSIFGKRIYK